MCECQNYTKPTCAQADVPLQILRSSQMPQICFSQRISSLKYAFSTTLRQIPSSKLSFRDHDRLLLHIAIQVVLMSDLSSQNFVVSIESARADARFAMPTSSASMVMVDTPGYDSNFPAQISGHFGLEQAPPAVTFRCHDPSYPIKKPATCSNRYILRLVWCS